MRYFDADKQRLPNEAAMTFQDKDVQRLAQATFVLWNAGTEVLRGEDLIEADPLRIVVAEGRVLACHVALTSSDATSVRLCSVVGDPESRVLYDYLNPGDGAVLDVLHDGTKTGIIGTAKGLSGGVEDWGIIAPTAEPKRTWFLRRVLPRLAILVGIAGAWGVLVVKDDPTLRADGFLVLGLLAGVSASFALEVIGNWWRTRRRHPATLSPIPRPEDDGSSANS